VASTSARKPPAVDRDQVLLERDPLVAPQHRRPEADLPMPSPQRGGDVGDLEPPWLGRSLPLASRPVVDFYNEVMRLIDELNVATDIWAMPVEIPGAIPFPDDRSHVSYDADAVRRFWLALVEMERVFKVFRTRFVGKASPVHLFWGALDLAYTRFSGRTAPPHPGGAPNCGPHVMWEAYSHEVSSCGYWPGPPGEEGVYYAYVYPEPSGYRDSVVAPAGARWDDDLGEFVLPYERVWTAGDPDALLLDFLQSTYEAAATTAGWDRRALERLTEARDLG
jgi:hypothetical protein